MNNCPIGGVVAAILFSCASPVSGAILDSTTDDLYDISPTATVSIRNTDGRIYVYGSDTPELRVKAVRRAFTKERLEQIKVNVAIDGESVVIETIYPPAPQGSISPDRSGTVDYTIVLPQTCTLSRVELANGEIILNGLRGKSMEAKLGRGLMHAANCFTSTRLTVANGGLNLIYGWWEAGVLSVAAEVASGNLRIGLPVDAALQLHATSSGGQIINRVSEDQKSSDARTLEIKIGGGSSADFTLRTGSADIRIEKEY